VDVTEDDHKVTIKADLPEVDQKDLKIEVADGHLTLRGERKLEREEKKGIYRRLERRYGGFARSFTLPETVDADKIVADYDKGVLRIEIPKREEARPKQIPVRVA
jgi:HSP20 family protein